MNINSEDSKAVSPPIEKFFLPQGNHTITVEVENQKTLKKKTAKKKVFSTKDWIKPLVEGPPNPAELLVEYRGLNQGITKTVSGKDKEYPIIYEDLNSSNLPRTGRGFRRGGIRVVTNGKTIELKDGRGDDANVEFTILSPSPGVSAKFSDDGRKLLTKGKVMFPLELSMMTIQTMLVKLFDQLQLLVQSGGKREKNMVKKLIQLT